ncbi:DEAD/DEAH box helicase [Rhodoferax sp. 4810]|nr:DEAD/DEAH box helicase [Rhodoferax jenense]
MYRSKEQTQFASRVAEHLSSGGLPLLLEGAAGLGKTRAYLVPMLAASKPVAICVPTRALATQLLESKDMAVIRTRQTIEVFTPRRNFDTLAQYRAHKQACHAADVLICTHQAALIDVLADGALLALKDRFAVLFDEADQLPDAAALRFDCAIDTYTFDLLGVKPGKDHRKTLDDVQKVLPRHIDKLEEPASVKAAIRGMRDALEDPVWYQTVGLDEEGAMRLAHRLPARALKRLLVHPRLIFVSATLTIGGTFNDFKSALGLKDTSPWSAAIEPLRHGNLDMVQEDWSKDAPDHLAKVASHVGTLQGAVLVIVTSHDDAATLGALVPGSTVRASRDETTGEAAARMQATGGHVLIAAGAWAGLDTPIRWRHVVMPKAPYGAPTILDEHEVSRYVDSRNMAVRRFRQGMARGLRTPDAVCTLHLLDGRFGRAEFAGALPARFAKAYQARYGMLEFRTRQSEFRKRIFEKFNGRCPISGCDEPSALEAAHLGAKGGWRTNHTEGILLRRDLHALMDAGKLEITDGIVSVASEHYREFDGVKVW